LSPLTAQNIEIRVQVVSSINDRSGNRVAARPVVHLNQDPKKRGIERSQSVGCLTDEEKQYWNATTLQNVAMQYSMDVLRFGYMQEHA
jgi:hypothetical protein